MKPLLYTLLALTLLAIIASACVFCLRVGVEIGLRFYENKAINCVKTNKKGDMYCLIYKAIDIFPQKK